MKKCLVVGGSGDIGKAICQELIRDGWEVGIHYFSSKPSLELSGSYRLLYGDLSSDTGTDAFLERLSQDWDAVIFAGGASVYGLFQESTDEEMDSLYHLHIKSMWKISRHVLPGMITRKQGGIVVVSSIWGDGGASLEVLYSSVKGAQRTFVHALSKEVGRSGIRVNGIAPGMIDTKMNRHFDPGDIEAIEEEIPMNRQGLPEEVAAAAGFLVSGRSSYITGEILHVSGGWKG